MNKYLYGIFSVSTIAIASIVCCVDSLAQPGKDPKTGASSSPNLSSFSKNIRPKPEVSSIVPAAAVLGTMDKVRSAIPYSIANENVGIDERQEQRGLPPTSIYSVGVGDVLLIATQSAGISFGQFTVRADGTIDFPLAGERVKVIGLTTYRIESTLSDTVRLFPTTRIIVKVRDYVSHGVLVRGMVDIPGFHQIQRDAVPLFVIRATAVVNPQSDRVVIKREKDGTIESYLLSSTSADAVIVYPGDIVDFTVAHLR